MARQNRVAATQLTDIAGTETAFSFGGEEPVEINSGAVHHVQFRVADGGSTDTFRFRFFVSNFNAPGAVPDAAQSLDGSEWSKLTDVILDLGNADHNDVWQKLLIAGYRWWGCSFVRDAGTTDTADTADCSYSDDGIDS